MAEEKINITPNLDELKHAIYIGDLIRKSPCNFWCVDTQKNMLLDAGYTQLNEAEPWNLKNGGKYFVTRNNSSLIAWRMPKNGEANGFMMVNSHCDYPTLKLKNNPEERVEGKYTVLNIEPYGGLIMNMWFDTPLSITGRIYVKTDNGIETRLVNVDHDIALIPNLPVHQNNEVNDGVKWNPQIDLQPLLGDANCPTVDEIVAVSAGVDPEQIVETELCLYRRETAKIWGANNQYLSSRSLDDQACVFNSLLAFLDAKEQDETIPVHIVFDNEEIGSSTKQGAASSMYPETLKRIAYGLGKNEEEYFAMLANSLNVCADNGHALHPNRPEKTDPTNRQYMGGGVLIKNSAAFKYTTDATASAIINKIAEKSKARVQIFSNRSDVTAGRALGMFLVPTGATISADIGLAQLAMHSTYESCAVKDLTDLKKLMQGIFSSSIKTLADGTYEIK